MEIIKKYANRKLYHTNRKSYITLSGIAGLAAAGHDVQVIDNESGSDITASVLAQAVLQTREPAAYSAQLLSGMLQFGGEALHNVRTVLGSFARNDDFSRELTRRLAMLVGAGLLSAEAAVEWYRTLLSSAGRQNSGIELENRAALERLRAEVARLTAKFPVYG